MTELETNRLRAFAALDHSKPIEYQTLGEWYYAINPREWPVESILLCDWRNKPTPSRVPYDYDSFPWPNPNPPFSVLYRDQTTGTNQIEAVSSKHENGFGTSEDSYDFVDIKFGELSLDGGSTWQPANREEQV